MARFPKIKLPNLKDPLSRRRFIILSLMAAAVLVIFSVGMLGATGTPQFCILCHSMAPEYKAWKKSAHANITCLACHAAPGGAFTKIAEDFFVFFPAGLKEFTGYEKPINAHSKLSQEHLAAGSCIRCHNIKTRNFTPKEGVIMTSKAHQKHLKKGLACTTCHNRVTHNGAEKYEPLKT